MKKQKSKKTLVIGASENPSRYSYRAINRLRNSGHEVVAIGRRVGQVNDVTIQTGLPDLEAIDTVTMYVNPKIQQEEYESYILSLKPERIIFNPGTENPAFIQQAKKEGILTEVACTLVMLSIDEY